MSSYVLYTLRDLRVDGERQAERALVEAAGARRRADQEGARLEIWPAEAQAARRAAREGAREPLAESAAHAQVRLRFWSRLDAEARACAAAVATDRAAVCGAAARGEGAA